MNSNPSTRTPSATLETSREAVNELLILTDSLKGSLSTCKVLKNGNLPSLELIV